MLKMWFFFLSAKLIPSNGEFISIHLIHRGFVHTDNLQLLYIWGKGLALGPQYPKLDCNVQGYSYQSKARRHFSIPEKSDGSFTKRFKMSAEPEMPLVKSQLHHRLELFRCHGNKAGYGLLYSLLIFLTFVTWFNYISFQSLVLHKSEPRNPFLIYIYIFLFWQNCVRRLERFHIFVQLFYL